VVALILFVKLSSLPGSHPANKKPAFGSGFFFYALIAGINTCNVLV